ncbi:MAG: fused MFS/spermidine synthase [Caldilineaceae bacterium]|nr:fused MFS/spermidine synthase [Caldilineaceae bacterium]
MTTIVQSADSEGTAWQAANMARIEDRAASLRQAEDGPLFADLWAGYIVVVTKAEDHLRLWLMDETAENTQWVQSDMDLRDPLRLVLGYTQAMTLALLWQADPERVLVTGLGGGCLPLMLHHHLPDVILDCVEVAPAVIAAATKFFPLVVDDRFQIHLADAKEFLAAQPTHQYDALFLDLFTDGGNTPAHLTDEEFFQLCHSRLRPDGILTMNLHSGAENHVERLERLRQIFKTVHVCNIHYAVDVVFATDQPRQRRFDLLRRAAEQQKRFRFHFPRAGWIAKIAD